jgi:hypothetical protein
MRIRLQFIIAVLVLAAGCKNSCKEAPCIHGNCVEGECVCPVNYAGADCSQCAADWGGLNCKVHLSEYVGKYHITGNESVYDMLNATPPPVLIDDTFEVFRSDTNHSALVFLGKDLNIKENGAVDTIWSTFEWRGIGQYNNATLQFKKNFDNSVFYYAIGGGRGHGVITNLVGVKIQ